MFLTVNVFRIIDRRSSNIVDFCNSSMLFSNFQNIVVITRDINAYNIAYTICTIECTFILK